jgi:hypothetical protein
MKFNKLLLILLLASCSTQVHKPAIEQPVPNTPTFTVEVSGQATPMYAFNSIPSDTFKKAIILISKHGNSNKFYEFMKSKRKYFSHTILGVDGAIKSFRASLARNEIINVTFYTSRFSKAIGGWNGKVISENTKFKLTVNDLAGHLLHETSHKYGFEHLGNYKLKNDNVNSFPYAVGEDFEAYLETIKSN